MILTITLLLAIIIGFVIYKKYKSVETPLKSGDIAVLRPAYKEEYASIPSNNVLHILEVEDEYVKVEYISFKDGSYNQQKLSKSVIKRVKRAA